MNGAQCLIQTLQQRGIDTLFGYPGGCIMPVYDALVGTDIVHVLSRHEQACALAAQGYARSSGRLGVCMATSGPGATNLITGVADAYRDSVPLLVITGQVPRALIGTDAFQETDVLGMTLGIVKHSALVLDPAELPAIIDEAITLAQSGRPGPVWIDIPKDVLLAAVPPHAITSAAASPAQKGEDEEALVTAQTLLRAAHKPLLYSGGGVVLADALDALRRFAEVTGLPAVETLRGLGNLGADHPHDLGMLGMHGSKAANLAVAHCDLLIVAGARFDDRATGKLSGFAPQARVIHLDADPAETGKLRAADVALHGDMAWALDALAQPLDILPWRSQCLQWHQDHGFPRHLSAPEQPIAGPEFVRCLSALAPEAILSCDVGQHQMWVAQHGRFSSPRRHLTSGGLGTMGFGLPAAIGAQFACPDATVFNITGDGSFMMNVQELATIKRYQLPIKLIILDNQCLGMVRQQQELFYGNRESEIDLSDNPDFCALARAFDIPAIQITESQQIRRGIETLLAYPGAMLLHVAMSRHENVWPIVKPGGANHEMIDQQTKESAA